MKYYTVTACTVYYAASTRTQLLRHITVKHRKGRKKQHSSIKIRAHNTSVKTIDMSDSPSGRYMDVFTIRSSGGRAIKHNERSNTMDYGKLLVEPIVLPDMAHIAVEHREEIADVCYFYPSGKKNKNMRGEMANAIREVYAISHSNTNNNSIDNSSQQNSFIENPHMYDSIMQSNNQQQIMKKKKSSRTGKTRSELNPLVHSRRKDEQHDSIKQLLSSVRTKQAKMVALTTLKV